MWNRKDLKAAGKAAFKANYWRCVLVAFILVAIAGVLGGLSGFTSSTGVLLGGYSYLDNGQPMNISITDDELNITSSIEESNTLDITDDGMSISMDGGTPAQALAILTAVAVPVILVGTAITILVLNPFTISFSRFFLQNSRKTKGDQPEGASLNELGYGFTHNFVRNVLTMFLKDLFTILWSLLFIIPGLIKSYSYRMVPYILSENQEMTATEAITRSREIMNGNKWRSFVLDLSFIGWILLSCITFGLVGIFYVYPYISATETELYEAIK